jgi:hypothetical protein
MKSSKAQTNTSIEQTYAMPNELQAAIDWSENAIQLRASVDAALDRNANEIKDAEAAYEMACQVQAQAEATLALAATIQESAQAEKVANAVAEDVETKRRALDRTQRVERALQAKAAEADQTVQEARSALSTEITIYSSNAHKEFAKEFHDALAPLIPLLAKGHALAVMTCNRNLFHFFEELKVPNPMDYVGSAPLLSPAGVNFEGFKNWAQLTKDGPIPEDLAATLQTINGAEGKLRAYQPYVPPHKRPKPYVIKGRSEGPGRAFGDY